MLKKKARGSFVGIPALLEAHGRQLAEFEQWAAKGDWASIHHNHYDWWMFPINESSSRGLEYTITKETLEELKANTEFVSSLKKGVEILLRSWGWDLETRSLIESPAKHQSWQNWPVRLYKAGRSMQLFGEKDYYESLRAFAEHLRQHRHSLRFSSSSLHKMVDTIEQWDSPLWPQEE